MIGKTNAVSKAKLQSGKSVSAGLNPKVIYADSGYDGLKDLTINAIGLDNLIIALDFSTGNQTVSTREGYYANTIIVTKPENFLASNIKKGEVIAGITGTYEGNPKPEQSKTVEFNPGNADSITIAPDNGYVLNGVEVSKPATMLPENIKSDVNIGGVVGTFKGGVDTSDATATSSDILLGKTAYANDEKVVGTIPIYNNEHESGYVPISTLKKLLNATKSTYYLFNNYKGTSVDDLISYDDTENVTNMQYMFNNCANLTTIPLLNTSKVIVFNDMFYGCSSLTEIPAIDVSNSRYSFSGVFYGCSSLTAIHMTGAWLSFDISHSTKFTTEALHEIIDNLGRPSTTQTLTMGSTNLAKVSEEDKAIATNKGWTLA